MGTNNHPKLLILCGYLPIGRPSIRPFLAEPTAQKANDVGRIGIDFDGFSRVAGATGLASESDHRVGVAPFAEPDRLMVIACRKEADAAGVTDVPPSARR
ncbi:hypothetical protein [Shinella sp. HZN7]|uniref:hypothetical protein n=1 Tax=Shinella sp. (strain HZN7) TaxID=879274 RepID=UPI000AC119D4|nr:hypothetical protein [Shinella sp. HZN7]